MLLLALLAVPAGALAAPTSGSGQIGPEQLRQDVHRPTVTPRSGPPGTEVTVRAADMPFGVLLVGVGVVGGGGHQMVGQGTADDDGMFELTVKVPDWAEPGTSHFFFIATADQRPRAMAPVFLVSDADGVVRVSGEVAETGGPCGATLTQETDRLGLVGAIEGIRPGTPVTVEGKVVERAGCEGTLVIDVGRILRGG